jgi:hypothetical protein
LKRLSLGLFSVLAFALAAAPAEAQLTPPPPVDPNASQHPPPPPQGPGLAPPPPMENPTTPPPGQESTEQQLQKAEKEDSGRNFELIYVNADLGGSYINMQQFDEKSLGLTRSKAAGPMFGLSAGVRLVLLQIGARVRYNLLSAFSMWQINGEVALKVPISKFDFLVGVHGGWSFLGSLGDASLTTSTDRQPGDISVRGFNGGLDVGADYYLASFFSIGVGGTGDILFLSRPPAQIPPDTPAEVKQRIENDPLYKNSGSSIGFGAAGMLRLGLHFGF